HVEPFLVKYCAGCHNPDDREGDLSLASYADLAQEVDSGPLVLAGQAKSSRLLRVITGVAEPSMPPEGMESPTPAEIELLRRWIDAGAIGPRGVAAPKRLIVPDIQRVGDVAEAITAIDASPVDSRVAVGRFGRVDVVPRGQSEPTVVIEDLPGKVNAVHFAADGHLLVVATGVAGLRGVAAIYDAASGAEILRFAGHSDTLYDAVLSPDGKQLATASYDKTISLWDVAAEELTRTISGHNGAVFDLEFSPDGAVLASASADETIKLWNVATGVRLDTLGQPSAEQYAVAFSPDGKYVVAGGADNRLRVWRLVAKDRPQINPLVLSRFLHERPIVDLAFTADGATLVTAAEDGTLKITESSEFLASMTIESPSTVVSAVAVSPSSDEVVVARMDGTWDAFPLTTPKQADAADEATDALAGEQAGPLTSASSIVACDEREPNDQVGDAQRLETPGRAAGVVA
ncbi:MAG: c-type cytochrome domain-containing protein, partial [Planctomycetota bacterium]